MLTFLIILLGIYVILSIALGIYDIRRIIIQGKRLKAKKEMLEALASIHGYSPDGWSRFKEYQDFLHLNKDLLDMYEDMMKRKRRAMTITMFSSFIVIIMLAYEWMKEKLSRPIEEDKKEDAS